jgi:pyruvate dehydrogenase E2 component (dihydrolipoamide acetyltransferase)
MAVEFFIHKMSEHMETAQILQWHVKEGDLVEKFQVIMEVMTDKVTAELESPETGVIRGIRPGAVDGATVPVGEPLCYIAAPGETVPVLPSLPGFIAAPPDHPERSVADSKDRAPAPEETSGVRASPVARRVAKELGLDLMQVSGTGPQGRITEADVRAHAAAHTPLPDPAPVVQPAPAASDHDDVPLTPIQRITGERMRASIVNAPQFALEVAADMTQALWLRDQLQERIAAATGDRLSVTGLLVRIVAAALALHPRANAEIVGDTLRLHHAINVGVAMGTDDGLVVPVIKYADRKSLGEITRELSAFQEKAASLRFSADDLAGGTFTLSNLGMHGIDSFRAIINPPQSAIVATGRICKTPVGLPDDTIALRPILTLTLTVDHRCMDGLQAARFLAEIKQFLEQPHLLLA